ncbi:DUF4412 domain-containing protein [Pseudotenacibaculum haliotis]|uniref:DUF4412 domain-containing protein n=1 Tax=Pseudotenacibaculum haliotis TaxID=1862138 RepID=A0ABW5LNA7_9FLAO
MIINSNSKKIVILIMLLAFSINKTDGQIWKKLKNKVSKKVEDKIDKKADKILDKTLSDSENKKSDEKATYKFDGSVTIEISTEKGDTASFEILFSNENKETICMMMDNGESGQIYNVITAKKIIAFINAGGMKIKKSSSADQFSQLDNSDKVPSKEDLKKTGNVKTIMGYTCHEYFYSNDGGSISAWITKDNFPIKSKYAPMLGMTKKSAIEGFVLELNSKSKSGERADVKVIKIDGKKKVTINSGEYKSMF